LKKIDLTEAKPRDLRAALAVPADENDVLAYYEDELKARIRELNEFLELDAGENNPERLAKALIEREFGILRASSNWWHEFAAYLVLNHVPGFSVDKDNKKHGAPRRWTHERLAQLFADVEFVKKRTSLSTTAICKILRTKKSYKQRWGNHSVAALRTAYVQAHELLRENTSFFLQLGGGEVLMGKDADLIKVAIERHALQR
jgi:hypothetical protein